jgi:hypothetical protein
MPLAGVKGLEPLTPGFGDRCSGQLSYTPNPWRTRVRGRNSRDALRRLLAQLNGCSNGFIAGSDALSSRSNGLSCRPSWARHCMPLPDDIDRLTDERNANSNLHQNRTFHPAAPAKNPIPGWAGPGCETATAVSAYCGFTNRPTRPAAPFAWPASLACSSGNVSPGGSSLGSRSVAITI